MNKHDLLWPDNPPPPSPARVIIQLMDAEADKLHTVNSAIQSSKETLGVLEKRKAELEERINALGEALLIITKRND